MNIAGSNFNVDNADLCVTGSYLSEVSTIEYENKVQSGDKCLPVERKPVIQRL